ncbi:MAG: hypothetical protein IH623_16755 [Verrucomicrobia bacterium]|nr:hypothetical protein [Verrucomicrobiota bacterium]
MKRSGWQWLKRMPALLTAPRPALEEQARRVIRLQRDIVMPAKLMVIGAVFYYLYFSDWVGEVPTPYRAYFEAMQDLLTAYIFFTLTLTVSFFVVRRFPAGIVQWVVFTAGLLDGVFLAGLTILTGGFESILYWVFPALIVLHAICIPLATPQIILNLILSGLFVGAGLIEVNVRDEEPEVAGQLLRPIRGTGEDIEDLPFTARWLRLQGNPFSKSFWEQLTPETRLQLVHYLETGVESATLKDALAKDLKRALSPRRVIAPVPHEYPATPYIPRLVVLVLLTFCCYGVQVLAAEKQRAEEEQQEFLARSAQLYAAGRLAAEFAHQIKNPLAIINNVSFSLQKALKGGRPETLQQIKIVQEEVAKADRIITQIMGYAQLTEGRVEKLDVVEELERVIREVFPPGVPTGVELERQFDGQFPPLLMQRRHFGEAVANLLLNAREAVKGQGRIVVGARCLPDYSVEVTVTDTGPGIPPEKMERIFEAYYTTKERGTGLGLAIVKHNAELYGGRVRVESKLGNGARIILLFPAKMLIKLGQ